MNILVAKNGAQLGPFSEADVRAKLTSGEFSPTDYGWHEGLTAWTPLAQLIGTAASEPAAPAPTPFAPQPQSYAPQPYVGPQGQNNPGGYAPQPYNSPYPSPYQPGAVSPWGNQGAFAYAGFWLRAAAYLIDGIILFVPLMVVGGILAAALNGHSSSGNSDSSAAGIAILLLYLAYLCFVVLYFSYMESSVRQATFGKMALGVKVTDLYGNRISFGRGVGRFFSRILSSFFFGIGYMMAGFTERKQALHDMVVSTLVIKK